MKADKEAVIIMRVPDANIRSIMENFPEASYGCTLRCVSYNYEKCLFVFLDEEQDGRRYVVTLPMLRRGLKKMFADIYSGKLKRKDIPAPIDDDALTMWDAEVDDMLVQYAVFGEAIYG